MNRNLARGLPWLRPLVQPCSTRARRSTVTLRGRSRARRPGHARHRGSRRSSVSSRGDPPDGEGDDEHHLARRPRWRRVGEPSVWRRGRR
jgi:hypothetical protein